MLTSAKFAFHSGVAQRFRNGISYLLDQSVCVNELRVMGAGFSLLNGVNRVTNMKRREPGSNL